MAGTEAEIIFKKETVRKLLMLFFKDDKTKVSNDAVSLMAEMLKVFVIAAGFLMLHQGSVDGATVLLD
ncbi:hypothetical protein NFI96_030239 [Prochilodus magdalenae]|nr:hypothetical protein NFI96_030239 [Prochilodus magdalenae]